MSVCPSGLAVARAFAVHKETCAFCKLALAVVALALLCDVGRVLARELADHAARCLDCNPRERRVLARLLEGVEVP